MVWVTCTCIDRRCNCFYRCGVVQVFCTLWSLVLPTKGTNLQVSLTSFQVTVNLGCVLLIMLNLVCGWDSLQRYSERARVCYKHASCIHDSPCVHASLVLETKCSSVYFSNCYCHRTQPVDCRLAAYGCLDIFGNIHSSRVGLAACTDHL